MPRRAIIAMVLVLTLAAGAAAHASTQEGAAGAADPELAELQDTFENLYRSLQVRGGIAERDRDVIRSLRDRCGVYRRGRSESKEALALELQLSMWLEDDDRIAAK